jgi:hypothetical protein
VPSGGLVQAVAEGSADPTRILVREHGPSDPATGLPSPTPTGPLVLAPGGRYELDFAWVPASDGPGGCPATTTPPASPTPTDTPTGSTDSASAVPGPGPGSSSGSTAGPSEPNTQVPAPTTVGSVALNHRPAAGGPVIPGPIIHDVCAGTVYTTMPMPAPAGTATTP